MRGARAGGPPASSNRGERQDRRARSGSADREGHGRPIGASTIRIESSVRGGAAMRRAYVLLIAIAIAIVVFHELTSMFAGGHVHGGSGRGVSGVIEMHPVDLVWALPAIAAGAVVGASLTVASASRAGITALARFGVPSIGPAARARANGLTWGAIAVLGVHFTGAAFEVVPGGHSVAAIVLGVLLGVGTFRLHRNSIEHEAYRTFNLIAMLLAVGSLASMSITPTGAWWTHNFSTLGTSDDIAAACFNIAIVLSGAGMAAMSAALTRAVADPRYGTRRFGLVAMRVLIALIGLSLMGVGLVPIDGATDLHNAAASSAAAAFAVLCLGVQLWARRLPRSLVIGSYASIAVEVIAMVAYDGIGVFNLTVFEVVAFTLVFAWLIALVTITHASPPAADAAGRRDLVSAGTRSRRRGRGEVAGAEHPSTRDGARRSPPGRIPSRPPRPPARTASFHDVRRALRRGDGGEDSSDSSALA